MYYFFISDKNLAIVKSQIENLELYVEIYKLNTSLDEFIKNCMRENDHILFFNWHPNTLIASGSFTRISFPNVYGHKDDVS